MPNIEENSQHAQLCMYSHKKTQFNVTISERKEVGNYGPRSEQVIREPDGA